VADSIVDWVNEHVYNELRWLAVAGTTWQACRIGGSRALKAGAPPHLRVMALDSALVHGRSLFQFFCTEGGVDGKARLNCGVASPLASALYVEIKDELNTYLMHLGSGRSTGHARSPDRPHLKERVVEIVLEVDRLTGTTVDISPFAISGGSGRLRIGESPRHKEWLQLRGLLWNRPDLLGNDSHEE
jgi:hypothetical protein